MQLLLATGNQGKVRELKALFEKKEELKNRELLSLKDMESQIEVSEDFNTFYENAYQKAESYAKFYKLPVIAEDSGLVVPALNGEPGVFSARYAGEQATDEQNNEKLLKAIQTVENKEAYYESTVIFFMDEKHLVSATGRCYGEITLNPKGRDGFGYDPLFYLPAYEKTMAEISLDEKNKISHRSQAFSKLIDKMLLKGFC